MFWKATGRQSCRHGRVEHTTEYFAMVADHWPSLPPLPAYAGFEPISKFASSSSARTIAE